MLLLFFCLLLSGIPNFSSGEYKIRCGEGNGFSFLKSEGGVPGRYRAEWCTEATPSINQTVDWVLTLRYSIETKPEICIKYQDEYWAWKQHSYFKKEVTFNLTCSKYVCLSSDVDLIFSGTCYVFNLLLKPDFQSNGINHTLYGDYVTYVNNGHKRNSFINSKAVFKSYLSEEHVVVAMWYLHLVPATDYTVTMCTAAGADPGGKVDLVKCSTDTNVTDVTRNCTALAPSLTRVRCELWPPPQPYTLKLAHHAPWTNGLSVSANIDTIVIQNTDSVYMTPTTPPVVPAPPSDAPWWALGGALLLIVGGSAALLACHSRLLRKLRMRVERDWPTRTAGEEQAPPEGGGGRILLLYARDCAPMMAAAAQLRTLLLHAADHVDDLYSPEVVRAAARAPGEWVRRALARADVRVVLLQSRAAACLHAPAGDARALERPLLNARVSYRAPHCSDALLGLALRLLADTAHTTHSYRKFYIATISGLEAEVVREVTPLRRYALPGAAALLLRDVRGAPPPPGARLEADLQRFAKAVRDLHDYVRAHPDYLDEELIFFDYD